jgi:hypothetical protein
MPAFTQLPTTAMSEALTRGAKYEGGIGALGSFMRATLRSPSEPPKELCSIKSSRVMSELGAPFAGVAAWHVPQFALRTRSTSHGSPLLGVVCADASGAGAWTAGSEAGGDG